MTVDFTGERVVPGLVDPNLWNEHFARYALVARYAPGRRVLDAGCGTGYGSAELSATAHSVTGIDLAADAIGYAAEHFRAPNLQYLRASLTALPFRAESFDLIAAFEVIEHLTDWPELITEAGRLLAPGGLFIVSTPNKSFYAKTRAREGPNPYHEHEFEYDEFRDALSAVFPHVSMLLQDHAEAVLFRSTDSSSVAGVRIEDTESRTEVASFYLALCSLEPHQPPPGFVYVPRSSNVVAEKILHIEQLEAEIAKKDGWMREAQQAHTALLDAHRALQSELEERNKWAAQLDTELTAARQRIADVQNELAAEQAAARAMAEGYERQIAELNAEVEKRTAWAVETEQRLTADLQTQTAELGKCVDVLHQTEALLEERTRWAIETEEQRSRLEGMIRGAQMSRWVRIGRMIGVGPELNNL